MFRKAGNSLQWIEEKNPLKQGLKRVETMPIVSIFIIEEKNPLKQGLKPDALWALIEIVRY